MAGPFDTLLQQVKNKLSSATQFIKSNPTPNAYISQQFQQNVAQPVAQYTKPIIQQFGQEAYKGITSPVTPIGQLKTYASGNTITPQSAVQGLMPAIGTGFNIALPVASTAYRVGAGALGGAIGAIRENKPILPNIQKTIIKNEPVGTASFGSGPLAMIGNVAEFIGPQGLQQGAKGIKAFAVAKSIQKEKDLLNDVPVLVDLFQRAKSGFRTQKGIDNKGIDELVNAYNYYIGKKKGISVNTMAQELQDLLINTQKKQSGLDYDKFVTEQGGMVNRINKPSTGGEIGGTTLYHGSDKVFDEMKVGQPTKRRMMMGEYDTTSHGMFFTPDKKIAGEYGKNVGEYRVNVKNPLDFRDRKNDAIFNEFDKLITNDPTIDIKPGEPGFSEFMYFDGELGKKFTQFIKSKGFDGAKLKETSEFSKGDFDTIVALDNAQVKSIKPSSGEIPKRTFEPPQGSMGFAGKAQFKQPIKQNLDTIIQEGRKQISTGAKVENKRTIKEAVDNLYTQWVDRFNPIVQASRKAKQILKTKGAELRPESDPEYLVRRLTGAGGIADSRFRTQLNPILKELEKSNISKLDMDTYLANKRIAGFGQAGRDIYGADPKKAQQIVNAIEVKYGNQIKGLADQLYAYQNKGFQEMIDSGFISPEAAKAIQQQNPDYAPLYRAMDDVSDYLGLPTKKLMQGAQPIQKIKGSTRQIESPVESIIGNTFTQRAAIEKNNVAKSIVLLQEIAPELGFKQVKQSGNDTITVWNNGKKEYWSVGQDIADVAKGVNEESMNVVLKILQAPAALLRQGATGRNPEFMIPNIIRDQLDAGVTSKYGYIPFIDYVSGLKSMLTNDDVYRVWERSGAKIDLGELSGKKSIRALFDEKTAKKGLFNWLSSGLDVLGKYSEVPTRVGLFKKAYQKTGNELIAAMESRDATVDFARMGSKMKVANSIIPFLNVGVQGFDKLIRSVQSNPGKVALMAGLYGAAPQAMMTIYNLQNFPQEYSEIPQFEKDSNFIIVKGRNEKGTVDYISIPKGNIIPAIANPTQSFLEYAYGVDRQSFGEMATTLISEMLPVLSGGSSMKEVALKTIGSNIPQAIKPAAEVLLNKSFYKYDPKKEQSKDIVPQYLQNRPAYKQAYEFTPQMYQKIGSVLDVSPLKLQNLMEGYLAGYTKIPAQITDMLVSVSRGEPIETNDKTLLRRFVKETYPSSAKAPPPKPTSPSLMERVTGKASASETTETQGTKPVSKPLEDWQIQDEKYKLKQSDAKTSQVGDIVFYKKSNGDIGTIDLAFQPTKPTLTGMAELDKKAISKYNSEITQKVNDVYDLFLAGKLSANDANTQIARLKGTTIKAGKKTPRPTFKTRRLPKLKALKVKKAKKIKAQKIKAIKFLKAK